MKREIKYHNQLITAPELEQLKRNGTIISYRIKNGVVYVTIWEDNDFEPDNNFSYERDMTEVKNDVLLFLNDMGRWFQPLAKIFTRKSKRSKSKFKLPLPFIGDLSLVWQIIIMLLVIGIVLFLFKAMVTWVLPVIIIIAAFFFLRNLFD